MRLLIVVPHFFDAHGSGQYGSTGRDPQPRLQALTQCVRSLYTLYGRQQECWQRMGERLVPVAANQAHTLEIELVICTCRDLHLLHKLPLPADAYRHHPTECDPLNLGYECHAVLDAARGEFDLYGYLEDDLILHDPAFFAKIEAFHALAGDVKAVLQPNRFERKFVRAEQVADAFAKVYIDFELKAPSSDCVTMAFDHLGQSIELRQTTNPHAGCFFLTEAQMALWSQQPDYLARDSSYVGPLESAASLALYRNFDVFKPAPAHAAYLEVEHYGQQWSQRLARVRFPG